MPSSTMDYSDDEDYNYDSDEIMGGNQDESAWRLVACRASCRLSRGLQRRA